MKFVKKLMPCLTLFSLSALNAYTQQFELTGQITGPVAGCIHLIYQDLHGKSVDDSSIVRNGNFKFFGKITEPTLAALYGAEKYFGSDNPNFTVFFLEPNNMKIEIKAGDYKNAFITGSKVQDENVALEKFKEQNFAKGTHLNREQQDSIIDISYFRTHPGSYITAWKLGFYLNFIPVDSLQLFYDHLSPLVQQSIYGKHLAAEIMKLRSGSPGNKAPDFTAVELKGNTISLYSFKGKYVLLDFWASWCVPCRKNSPHMVEIYKKFHDKGLEIMGISDDDNQPAAWKKAVTADGLGLWYNVLRGLDSDSLNKGEENEKNIAEKYGIRLFPTKILIDPNSKIIGRYDGNIGGKEEDMDKMLDSVFNN